MAGEWTEAAFEGFSESGTATEAVRGVFGDGPVEQVAGFFGEGTVSGGGSWSFDPDQIKTVIGEWESLLEDLRKDRFAIQAMQRNVLPPSEDESSSQFANDVTQGLDALMTSNQSMADYVRGFIKTLYRAAERTKEQDLANAESYSLRGMEENG